jgi:hypothetical protein
LFVRAEDSHALQQYICETKDRREGTDPAAVTLEMLFLAIQSISSFMQGEDAWGLRWSTNRAQDGPRPDVLDTLTVTRAVGYADEHAVSTLGRKELA